MKTTPKIDAFRGVVKPDVLKEHIRSCVGGSSKSKSYIRGSLQYLERNTPNPFIVPLLKKVLERANGV